MCGTFFLPLVLVRTPCFHHLTTILFFSLLLYTVIFIFFLCMRVCGRYVQAKLFAGPVGWKDGKALFNIGELMQLGMERGKSAREAIQIMGDAATTYGFYGESYDPSSYGSAYVMGEAGEGLSVIDPQEAWIFHILPDDSAASAVWVAQKVPDTDVAVIANSFIIRHVIANSDDFMHSANLWDVARRMGFWDESRDELLDFKTVYAPQRYG